MAGPGTDGWGGEAFLVTDRLVARPFGRDDLPVYQAICADPKVMEYLGGPWSPERTERSMLGANENLRDQGYGMVAVERRDDGAFLGSAGLTIEVWYPGDIQVGWRFVPAHWGNGYATEAARAWLDHGFSALGQDCIISIADVPNERSVAVMRRLGMRWDHEAELLDGDEAFDAVIYAMTASEWRDQREA